MSFFGPQGSAQAGRAAQRFSLHQPVSIAIYDSYDDAQHAVDYLADQRFPVNNLSIVGTDLKSIERITGGLNWAKVILTAVMSGVTWGVLAALFVKLLVPSVSLSLALFGAVAIFILANLITSSIGYAMTGGRRDFTSATQVMATRYEILGEAPVASQARALLSGGGGRRADERRAARPDPAAAQASQHPGWEQPHQEQPHQDRPASGEVDPSAFPPPAWPAQPGHDGTDQSAAGGHDGPSRRADRFDPTDRSQG